jgi:hypothetical protein
LPDFSHRAARGGKDLVGLQDRTGIIARLDVLGGDHAVSVEKIASIFASHGTTPAADIRAIV